jgi:outer membrane protein assembly factor BamA
MNKYIFPLMLLALSIPSLIQAQPYIRDIKIIRLNVFDRQLENSDNYIYRMANKLHVVTRESVIRRELLVHEGEQFDKEALVQTMRNIRSLPFIGEAEVKVTDVAADSVDIVITTEDLWTTVAGISSEGGGGFYNVTFYADEKNLGGLGLGIETEATLTSDNNDGFSIGFYDSRLLGTYNGISLLVKDYAFANMLDLVVYRPYYSLDSRFSYSIAYNRDRLIPRLFYRGEEIFRYKKNFDYVGASAGMAFGRYTRFQPSLQYIYSDYSYSELPGYPDMGMIPEDEKFSGPGFGLKFYTHRFKTARYLDEFGTTEDLTEHASIGTSVAWSGPTFDGDYQAALLSINGGFFYQPLDFLYAGFSNTYSSYYVGHLRRERITNSSAAITYIKPTEYQLLAFRAISQFAWLQKPDYQLVLGGDNGLRGYPDRYLTGTRLFLANLEYRIFSPLKILTAGLGGAVFFDGGYVWDDGQDIKLKDLKTDVGVGLRIGLTKSSTARIIRLDLARALNEDNWYISFGTENIFDLSSFQ